MLVAQRDAVERAVQLTAEHRVVAAVDLEVDAHATLLTAVVAAAGCCSCALTERGVPASTMNICECN